MPKVEAGEKRGHYIQRYMKSDYQKGAPAKQRLAIAYSEYKQQTGKGKKKRGKRKSY